MYQDERTLQNVPARVTLLLEGNKCYTIDAVATLTENNRIATRGGVEDVVIRGQVEVDVTATCDPSYFDRLWEHAEKG